jgi:endonuclease/exonuclease/phosphatase family metal-dependent hydrolase
VIAMQEAPTEASPGQPLAAYLEAETEYRHVLYLAYDAAPDEGDRPEGLAVLSNLPCRDIRTSWAGGAATHNSFAVNVHVEVPGTIVGITNVHLDWEHQARRVEAIADVVDRLIERHPADVEILCGDFNDHDDGPVAAYLEGHDGFHGVAGRPERRWLDAVASSMDASAAPVTLDFAGNPRWRGTEVTERSGRFDRIYLRGRGRPAPRIIGTGVFGQRPANRFGIVPSDHYGVFVDLEL